MPRWRDNWSRTVILIQKENLHFCTVSGKFCYRANSEICVFDVCARAFSTCFNAPTTSNSALYRALKINHIDIFSVMTLSWCNAQIIILFFSHFMLLLFLLRINSMKAFDWPLRSRRLFCICFFSSIFVMAFRFDSQKNSTKLLILHSIFRAYFLWKRLNWNYFFSIEKKK